MNSYVIRTSILSHVGIYKQLKDWIEDICCHENKKIYFSFDTASRQGDFL